MKLPFDVTTVLMKRFRTRRYKWIEEALRQQTGNLPDQENRETESDWPMAISLDAPSGMGAVMNWARFEDWIKNWRQFESGHAGKVIWEKRILRHVGIQTVPLKLVLASPDEAAESAGLGMADLWQRIIRRGIALLDLFPGIEAEAAKEYEVLAQWEEPDFKRLLSVLQWFDENRASGLFIRQLPVEGVDTKWYTSGRQKSIVALLCARRRSNGEPVPDKPDFISFCGLREPPSCQIRLRLLDENLRKAVGGLEDFSASAQELASLPISPKTVFISENRDSGLAFSDMPDSAVIFGLGNNVAGLELIPWLMKARVVYWGDIDTFGYRILSEARSRIPHLVSVMMDKQTMSGFASLRVIEKRQTFEESLPHLTAEEASAYHELTHNRIGFHLRIEQERIPWPYAQSILRKAAEVS